MNLGGGGDEEDEDEEDLGPEPERLEHDLLGGIHETTLSHRPVMLHEVLSFASAGGRETILDCTVGQGGHAFALLSDLRETRNYIGLDVDPNALATAREKLAPFTEGKKARNIRLQHRSYVEAVDALDEAGIEQADVILMDLGASTYQLTDPERGFSLTRDGPLDMRMNPGKGPTALDLIRGWSEAELRKVLADGEVRMPGRVTRALKRSEAMLRTTAELAELVKRATPADPARRSAIHPATLVFQTLRIHVNRELENVEAALPLLLERLKPGGRLIVISFHSLEDRIVKHFMQQEVKGCTCPPDFPMCTCKKKPTLELLSRRPLVPGEAELAENAASRSAKMRVARRL